MRHANLGASMASAGLLAKREAIEDKWCRSGAESFDTSDVPGRKLRTSDVSGTEDKKKKNLVFSVTLFTLGFRLFFIQLQINTRFWVGNGNGLKCESKLAMKDPHCRLRSVSKSFWSFRG